VPVLSDGENRQLTRLAQAAIEEKSKGDVGVPNDLAQVEREIDGYVLDLYGLTADAQFWVVR
jgi:hypothetical protein